MGFLTSFIVLIERRLLRPMALLLLSSLVLITGLGVQAGSAGKPKKLAKDLEVAVASPTAPGQTWVRTAGGIRIIDAVIVSNDADPLMTSLRAEVGRLGGTVHARFSSVQAMSVSLPASAYVGLAARPDVVSISPNRTIHRSGSLLELTTGAQGANVRTATGATSYSGLDGTGVGIAVLDSGVMSNHKHFEKADGNSRIARQVSQVGKASNAVAASAMAPGSAERLAFESSIDNSQSPRTDAYGHGSHVAAVAAGRGNYQLLFDTTGGAPGASTSTCRCWRPTARATWPTCWPASTG